MEKKASLFELIQELNPDQKIALLGYILGKYMDDEKFWNFISEGVDLLKGITFDVNGKPVVSKKIDLQ
ncbi:hypothetical protein [Brevibacillus sp. 179-C9.3 HS]|uniref:hypothetical protein n=1 Tax=unclassified Brevibacillus TaxID=2684853 RepID=UPI0039A36447